MTKGHSKRAAPEKEGKRSSDDGLDKDDRKLLNSFLKSVDGHLLGVSNADRERALSDLRKHVVDKSRAMFADNAIELTIFSLGSPESIAGGLRNLYGYGPRFKALLVAFTFMLGLVTVPYFLAWSIIALMVLFLVIANFGMKTDVLVGGLMGLSAAVSRGVMALTLVKLDPRALTDMVHGTSEGLVLGGTQATVDFMLVSMFLVLVGLLSGHIRERAMKAYLALDRYIDR